MKGKKLLKTSIQVNAQTEFMNRSLQTLIGDTAVPLGNASYRSHSTNQHELTVNYQDKPDNNTWRLR